MRGPGPIVAPVAPRPRSPMAVPVDPMHGPQRSVGNNQSIELRRSNARKRSGGNIKSATREPLMADYCFLAAARGAGPEGDPQRTKIWVP